MRIWCLGTNHKVATLEVREKLACTPDLLEEKLKKIRDLDSIKEVVLLSTCNRTELYCLAANLYSLLRYFAKNFSLADLRSHTYVYVDQLAVAQLLRVGTGVDSMILGEPEILGQLKQAYQIANSMHCVDKHLRRLFQRTFSAAKVIRLNTGIGLHPISITSVVVKLAKQMFSDFSTVTIMILGAGSTAKQLLKQLQIVGAKKFIIANRSVSKAEIMLKSLGIMDEVTCIALSELRQHLFKVDILIGATASQLPIIGKGIVEQAMRQRRYRPMCLVDVAVPRDMEPEIAEIDNAYLYSIDDLQSIVAKHKDIRVVAAKQAEFLIQQEAEKFMLWLYAQNYTKTIVDFRQAFARKQHEVTKKALQNLESGASAKYVIEKISYQLAQQFLHVPTKALKLASESGDIDTIEAIERIFKIEETIT